MIKNVYSEEDYVKECTIGIYAKYEKHIIVSEHCSTGGGDNDEIIRSDEMPILLDRLWMLLDNEKNDKGKTYQGVLFCETRLKNDPPAKVFYLKFTGGEIGTEKHFL